MPESKSTGKALTARKRAADAAADGRESCSHFRENLSHAAGWPFCLVRLHYRFMFHGIERLVEGVQFRDAEAIQNLSQNAVGGGNSLDQSVCLSRSRVGRAGFDGTPQIVDDLQQLAGKVRDRVLLRVLLAPFPLAPGILGLGQRPHQPLAQGGVFGCEIAVRGFARR